MSDQQGGQWQHDPTGRWELRYWNGQAWTDHVRRGDETGVDPIESATTTLASQPPPDRGHPGQSQQPSAEQTGQWQQHPGVPPPGAPPYGPTRPGNPADDKWYHSPAAVVLGLTCCFPIGLVFLWTHPRYTQKTKMIVTGVVATLVVIITVAGGSSEPEQDVATKTTEPTTTQPSTTTKPKATTTEAPSTTAAPTTAAPPTEPPTTQAPKTDAERMREVVIDKLGKTNRKFRPRLTLTITDGEVTAQWAINENLTEGLTKDGARLEGVDILQGIADSGIPYSSARLVGTYPLVDELGNSKEQEVIDASYSKELIDEINFDGFDFKNAFEVADLASFVHPSFVY